MIRLIKNNSGLILLIIWCIILIGNIFFNYQLNQVNDQLRQKIDLDKVAINQLQELNINTLDMCNQLADKKNKELKYFK